MRTLRSSGARRREALTGYLFLLPSLIGVCVFLVFPMADTVRRSFFSVAGEWRGWENYQTLMGNASFRLAAGNTARFLAIAIPLLLLLSLGAALAVRRAPAFVKSSFLVPLALPVASLALIWRLLFDSQGLVNAALDAMGVNTVAFLDSGASFWVLVGSYIWKNVGFGMVLFLAALTNVPQNLYEAAQLDGASPWKRLKNITMPMISPMLFLNVVLVTINGLKSFNTGYLIGGVEGNPNNSTLLFPVLIYRIAFNTEYGGRRLGYASALAYIFFLVIMVFTAVQFIMSKFYVNKDVE